MKMTRRGVFGLALSFAAPPVALAAASPEQDFVERARLALAASGAEVAGVRRPKNMDAVVIEFIDAGGTGYVTASGYEIRRSQPQVIPDTRDNLVERRMRAALRIRSDLRSA